MRGLTFHGPRDMRVEDLPEPGIQEPTDALLQVTLAGICGSDLHIYGAGEAFGFPPGARVGHEAVGTVVAVGSEVSRVRPGDRVLSSPSVACGACTYCLEGLQASCVRWSLFGWAPRLWAHGGVPEGAQSQLMRVPLADTTLHPLPEALAGPERETSVMPLVDMMSTGWHGLTAAGVTAGQGVVVIGDGAVGLASVHGARARGAEPIVCLGHHPERLQVARALGASETIEEREAEAIAERVRELTRGEGAHAVIDTISGTESMQTAHACVRAGGTIACLGMDHFMGKTPSVSWFDQFVRNITITGGLVPGPRYLPELVALAEAGRIDPSPLISHELTLAEAPEGYRLMAERAEGVVKVALRPGE